MIKLPEPAMKSMSLSNEWTPFYTESQLRQAIRDALEAAAKVCEGLESKSGNAPYMPNGYSCAAAIRGLKEDV